MSMSTSTQPYSLTAEHNRNGANGFTRYESVSEFVDNSLDANAPGHTMAAICEEESSKGYHISYDLGDGAQNLLSLYGIGTAVCKKRGATRGLKNYGHGAAVGRFNPARVIHVTRHSTASRASTLIYNTGALYRAIDDAKRAGECDFRQIDAELNPFSPTSGGLTDEIRELLQHLQTLITSKPVYDSLANVLTKIIANEQPTFHLMIMEYEVFPEEMIAEIKDALCAYRRDYYTALVAGHYVEYLTPDGISRADASNAVDHMGPPERARLAGKIELRSDAASATDYLHFTVASFGTGEAPAEFWLSYRDDGMHPLFYKGTAGAGPFTATQPAGWETALPVGDDEGVSFMCSVLSHKEELDQKKAIGSGLCSDLNDMRGVQLRYHDHSLGLPLYSTQWEDKRNVGALRIQIATSNTDIAERFFGIKTKKHSANFDGMHPLMRRFLSWVVQRVIIKKYSHYTNYVAAPRGECPGVSDWKFPYFCALMMNAKAKDPTIVKPIAAPRLPASAAVSSASSVASSHSSDYTSDTESDTHIVHVPVPVPAAPVLTVTPVSATQRFTPISPRQLAVFVLRITTRLSTSNLAELAETASTIAIPGLAGKLSGILELVKSLETVGLKYTESD